MKTVIANAIAQFKSVLDYLRLKQLAGVMLAGFLLLLSTACSSGVNAQTPAKGPSYRSDTSYKANLQSGSDHNPYSGTKGNQRERYKPTQKKVGGMNNYNDDPKYDNAATQAQTDKFISRVEKNLKKQPDSPQALLHNIRDRNPLDDKAQEFSSNVTNVAQDLKTTLSEGTKKGVKNLQANTERAKNKLPQILEAAKQNALVDRAGQVVQDRA